MPVLKPTRGLRLNKSHPLARGLVGCWLMNEGSGGLVKNLASSNNNANFNANMPSTAWMSGRYGSAINFAGIDCGDGLELDSIISLGRNPWSFVCSVDVDDVSFGPSGFFGKTYAASNYTRAYIDDTGKMYVYDDDNDQCSFASYVLTGKHHYAIVFDGTNIITYRDGVYFGQAAHPGSANFNIYRLMNYGYVTATSYSLDGRCDFIMIYNTLVSASEIALLYRKPFCMAEEKISPAYFFVTTGGTVYQELNLTITAAASVAKTDAHAMVETDKAIQAEATAIGSEIQQMVETDKEVSADASVSCTEIKVVFELNLTVTAAGNVIATDAHTMIEAGKGVTAAASPAVIDAQTMVETELGVSADSIVSCTDTMGLLAHIAAFMILRQCTT